MSDSFECSYLFVTTIAIAFCLPVPVKYSTSTRQLLSLNPTDACRSDELPPTLLRIVAQELEPASTFLFNQPYPTVIVPVCNGNKP